MPADDNIRTFGVLIEYRLPGGGIDRDAEFIDFLPPESAGPEQTLASIARCRVETKLLADMAATKANKNWQIVAVTEIEPIVIGEIYPIAGPAEPGHFEGTNGRK